MQPWQVVKSHAVTACSSQPAKRPLLQRVTGCPRGLFCRADWWATQNTPYITMHDSKFVNLAGSFNSSHRFLRAAKLPSAGYRWEW